MHNTYIPLDKIIRKLRKSQIDVVKYSLSAHGILNNLLVTTGKPEGFVRKTINTFPAYLIILICALFPMVNNVVVIILLIFMLALSVRTNNEVTEGPFQFVIYAYLSSSCPVTRYLLKR